MSVYLTEVDGVMFMSVYLTEVDGVMFILHLFQFIYVFIL